MYYSDLSINCLTIENILSLSFLIYYFGHWIIVGYCNILVKIVFLVTWVFTGIQHFTGNIWLMNFFYYLGTIKYKFCNNSVGMSNCMSKSRSHPVLHTVGVSMPGPALKPPPCHSACQMFRAHSGYCHRPRALSISPCLKACFCSYSSSSHRAHCFSSSSHLGELPPTLCC